MGLIWKIWLQCDILSNNTICPFSQLHNLVHFPFSISLSINKFWEGLYTIIVIKDYYYSTIISHLSQNVSKPTLWKIHENIAQVRIASSGLTTLTKYLLGCFAFLLQRPPRVINGKASKHVIKAALLTSACKDWLRQSFYILKCCLDSMVVIRNWTWNDPVGRRDNNYYHILLWALELFYINWKNRLLMIK